MGTQLVVIAAHVLMQEVIKAKAEKRQKEREEYQKEREQRHSERSG